jgi:hypothetical protein
MHTSAIEKPIRMRNRGTRNESRCTRLRTMDSPSSPSTRLGGTAMAAIMEVRRKTAKNVTSVWRIFAISLYLRKYLRSVISAAR